MSKERGGFLEKEYNSNGPELVSDKKSKALLLIHNYLPEHFENMIHGKRYLKREQFKNLLGFMSGIKSWNYDQILEFVAGKYD